MAARTRPRRIVRFLLRHRRAMVGLLILALAGCGASPLADRYRAERDLWRTQKLDRQARLKEVKDSPIRKQALAGYERILKKYPLTAAGSDSAEIRALAWVRGAAAMGFAQLSVMENARGRAVQVLWEHRMDAPWDLDVTLGLHAELAQLLGQGSSPDSLLLLLKEMSETLPAGAPDGRPIGLVLEAPLRQADLLQAMGRKEEAEGQLRQARTHYATVANKAQGTALQVAALVQEGNTLTRLGLMREAEQVLRDARALPAASPYDAQLLFSLGSVREQGANDPAGAIPFYRELLAKHAADPTAPQAQLRMGVCFAGAGQSDSALAALARTETLFPNETETVAQSRMLSARVLAGRGDWSEAIRRLRALKADFPRTGAALQAPLDIAEYYKRKGDQASSQTALRDAASDYQALVQELSKNPRSGGLLLAAMDHLFEVWTRLEDWPKAVDLLLMRAQGFPGDPRSPLLYVQAAAIQEQKLHDRPAAVATLEKLTQRYPDTPLAARARQKIAQLGGGDGS